MLVDSSSVQAEDPMDITPLAKSLVLSKQEEDDVAISDQPTDLNIKQSLVEKLHVCDNGRDTQVLGPDKQIDARLCSADQDQRVGNALKGRGSSPTPFGQPLEASLGHPAPSYQELVPSSTEEAPAGPTAPVLSACLPEPVQQHPTSEAPPSASESLPTCLVEGAQEEAVPQLMQVQCEGGNLDAHPVNRTEPMEAHDPELQFGSDIATTPAPKPVPQSRLSHGLGPVADLAKDVFTPATPTLCIGARVGAADSHVADAGDAAAGTCDPHAAAPAAAPDAMHCEASPMQVVSSPSPSEGGNSQTTLSHLPQGGQLPQEMSIQSSSSPTHSIPKVEGGVTGSSAAGAPRQKADEGSNEHVQHQIVVEQQQIMGQQQAPCTAPAVSIGRQAEAVPQAVQWSAAMEAGQGASSCHPGDSSQDLQQVLAELSAKLSRVEHSRDELARQQGQYKATIAKLEGTVSSTDRRLRHQNAECEDLKSTVQQLRTELAATKIMVDMTPERCRASSKSLLAEATRAQTSAADKEGCIKKLQVLIQLEASERTQLSEFLEQERGMLVEQLVRTERVLAEERAAAALVCSSLAEAQARAEQAKQQLQDMNGQIYFSQEKNVEMESELAQARYQVQQLQGSFQEAQALAQENAQARARAEQELSETRDVSMRMFKQMKGIMHTIERQGHVFQSMPELSMMVRGLQEWVQSYQQHDTVTE